MGWFASPCLTLKRSNEDSEMETKATLCGIPGTLTVVPWGKGGREGKQGLFMHQKWVSERRTKTVDGEKVLMHAEVCFDDNCKNNHNSFAVTGHGWYDNWNSRDWDFGRSCHDMIEKVFPELKHLIKWHFMSSDSPMHYVANTVYHASDKDCWGLGKGEKRQIINGRSKEPVWSLRADATGCALKTALDEDEDVANLPLYRLQDMFDSAEKPDVIPKLFWEPCWRIGKGKERDFNAARNTGVWPDATDEQLSLPKEDLTKLLEARLPQMVADFKEAVASTGCFEWEAPAHDV
ncbi:hypothetical protein uan_023 [Pseudomonas phage UAntarctica]|nr:hypothetical protein uan_023 [Pseudomonas phage UAntarctica]